MARVAGALALLALAAAQPNPDALLDLSPAGLMLDAAAEATLKRATANFAYGASGTSPNMLWRSVVDELRANVAVEHRVARLFRGVAEDPEKRRRDAVEAQGDPLRRLQAAVTAAASQGDLGPEDALEDVLYTVTERKAQKMMARKRQGSSGTHTFVGVTLVTQLSLDRIWMLNDVCKRWESSIVAVLYLVEADQELLGGRRIGFDEACTDRVTLVEYIDHSGGLETYPVNRLRNLGVAHVPIGMHFLVMDIDHWPMEGLDKEIRLIAQANADAFGSDVAAIVIPTFEHSDLSFCEPEPALDQPAAAHLKCLREAARESCPKTWAALEHGFHEDRFEMYHKYFPNSHNSTVYELLWTQWPTELRELACIQSERYEPYLVVKKSDALPTFDEALVGYGLNKIQWIWSLRVAGFQYAVAGKSFLFHVKHDSSKARIAFRSSIHKKRNTKSEHHDLVYKYAGYLLEAYDRLVASEPSRYLRLCEGAQRIPRPARHATPPALPEALEAVATAFLDDTANRAAEPP